MNNPRAGLFSDLSEQSLTLLNKGFGEDIARLYRTVPRQWLQEQLDRSGNNIELKAPTERLLQKLRVPYA